MQARGGAQTRLLVSSVTSIDPSGSSDTSAGRPIPPQYRKRCPCDGAFVWQCELPGQSSLVWQVTFGSRMKPPRNSSRLGCGVWELACVGFSIAAMPTT